MNTLSVPVTEGFLLEILITHQCYLILVIYQKYCLLFRDVRYEGCSLKMFHGTAMAGAVSRCQFED